MCAISAKGVAVLNALSSKEYFKKMRESVADVDETVQVSRVSKEKHE